MGEYKYPYIPKEYYAAVRYACNCIRKYGTFNVAVNTAAKAYGVDRETVAKYVRERQGAGQRGKTRDYKYYVLVGWNDRWLNEYDLDMLWSQYDPEEWEKERKMVAIVVKATNEINARKKAPTGKTGYDGRTKGEEMRIIKVYEFSTEKEANDFVNKYAVD